MKVLISIYDFNSQKTGPIYPKERLMGWKLIEQINQRHKLWILTNSQNRDAVMTEMAKGKLEKAKVIFIDLSKLKIILYKMGFKEPVYYYFWQFYAWRKAKQLHKEIKFDMAHQITFGKDWMPGYIGAFLPVPFIWGPIGGGSFVPNELLKELCFFVRLVEKWKRVVQRIGRNLWIRRKTLKRSNTILVCTKETKRDIPRKYHSKIHYFPKKGIKKEEIGPVPKKKQKQKQFAILSAGRMHRFSGFDLAIRAFHLFSKENQNTRLEILGKGKEKKNLEELIEQLDLKYRVKIKPWMERKKLLSLMQRCDVFFYPGLNDEKGTLIVDAMAQGKPVVGLDIAGPGFHIQKEWGIKIKPRTKEMVINGLALALEKLYKSEPLRRKLGRAARKRVKDYYIWDEMGKSMEKIYQSLINPDNVL